MGGGGRRGKILGLADLIRDHGGALEYDLVTRTRHTLADVGGALPWGALRHFVAYLGHDSALWRETHPEEAKTLPWEDGSMVAPLLADVFDVTALVAWTTANKGAKHPKPKPKPYPRPWVARANERHYGSKPIPISEFDSWWDRKREEARAHG